MGERGDGTYRVHGGSDGDDLLLHVDAAVRVPCSDDWDVVRVAWSVVLGEGALPESNKLSLMPLTICGEIMLVGGKGEL